MTELLLGALSNRDVAEIVLTLLERESATVSELVSHLEIPQPTVSQHVARLIDLGILVRERQSHPVRLAHADEARAVLESATELSRAIIERRAAEDQQLRRRLGRTRLRVSKAPQDRADRK